MVKIHKILKY